MGSMASRDAVLRPIDDGARALARRLVRTARFGSLAVLEKGTGHPWASRAAVAPDIDGAPVMLLSALSPHTAAIDADPRCSLLLGEPGRGDPLAHPRITVLGRARRLDRGSPADERVRARFLARHPKAALYAGFGDFAFFRLEPARAVLVGGFGRAFDLAPVDFLDGDMPDNDDTGPLAALAAGERGAIEHMNRDHADAVSLYATRLCRAEPGDWRIVSLDAHGIDMMSGDRIERLEFDAPLSNAAQLREVLVDLAARARAIPPGAG